MDWALAVEALEDGLIIIGPDERVAACNPAAARLLGMSPAALAGHDTDSLGLPEMGMLPGHEGAGWLRVSTASLADGARVVTLTDVTAERDRDRELRRLAGLDDLTGLPDREHFLRLLQSHLDSQRAEDAGGAVLLLELDRSAPSSERELVRVAEALRERLRTDDLLARVDSGAFALLLPRAHAEDAARLARSLVEDLVPAARAGVAGLGGATDAEAALRSSAAA